MPANESFECPRRLSSWLFSATRRMNRIVSFRHLFLPVLLCCLHAAETGLASDPASAERAYQEGTRHLRNQEYDLAIESLSRAIKLAPDQADAYEQRAAAYQALGKDAKALEDLERYIELEAMAEASGSLKRRLLAWMAIAFGFGLAGAYLGSLRGQSAWLSIAMGMVLGPAGLVVLLVLPERTSRPTLNERGPFVEEDVTSSRECPACCRQVSIHTPVCPRCHTKLNPVTPG